MSGMKRGVDAARQQMKKGGGDHRETYRFNLKGGETRRVRFLGLFRRPYDSKAVDKMDREMLKDVADVFGAVRADIRDDKGKPTGKKEKLIDAVKRRMEQAEPVCSVEHWIPRLNTSIICSDSCGGCVSCFTRAASPAGKKAIGYAADKFHFSVYVLTKQHKVTKRGGDENEYRDCTMDESGACKLCSKAKDDGPVFPARAIGARKWSMGKQRAAAILAENDKLGKKCLFCNGRLRTIGWACGNPECGEELEGIDAEGVDVKCTSCRKTTIPIEILTSSTCTEDVCGKNSVRGTLADCDIEITRTGDGKDDTTYSFDALPFDAFEPEDRVRYIRWEEELKPPSTAEQAAQLGLKSDPFTKAAVGGEDYDDDEDEDDESDDDDDEDYD